MWWHMRRNQNSSYCIWNVMAHAQKPEFVLLHLKCDDTCAETRIRLTAVEMWWHMRRNQNSFYCIWNVMAHAEEPDFVFWWNRRVHLNQHGCQFSRLLAAEMCASAVVMVDTPCYKVVWRVLATHSIHQFPLHFPSCASPCAITFQLESAIMPVHMGFLSVRTPMFGAAVKRRYCMSTSNQTCPLCWILHNF
jgi:hypothetical protein